MKCSSCGISIKNKPALETFTIDSGIWRYFCLNCVKMGYNNLKGLPNPNEDQIDLMIKFGSFIKRNLKKRIES